VKDVETFMGLYDDVRTDFGLMVTTEGYSHATKNRADAPGMRIEIVPYDELAHWEPPFQFCGVCTDAASDNMPGASTSSLSSMAMSRQGPSWSGAWAAATAARRCTWSAAAARSTTRWSAF